MGVSQIAENTEFVAWWGAIVATLVLLWEVFKWFQSGPKIRSRVTLNTHYEDGEVIKKENTEDGEVITYQDYCHLELVNVGKMPTTIIGVKATSKMNGKRDMQMEVTQQVFAPHFGKHLPHVLSPGEVWSCRLPMDRYACLFQYGIPELQVRVSHRTKPIVVCATKAANKAAQSDARTARGWP